MCIGRDILILKENSKIIVRFQKRSRLIGIKYKISSRLINCQITQTLVGNFFSDF